MSALNKTPIFVCQMNAVSFDEWLNYDRARREYACKLDYALEKVPRRKRRTLTRFGTRLLFFLSRRSTAHGDVLVCEAAGAALAAGAGRLGAQSALPHGVPEAAGQRGTLQQYDHV